MLKRFSLIVYDFFFIFSIESYLILFLRSEKQLKSVFKLLYTALLKKKLEITEKCWKHIRLANKKPNNEASGNESDSKKKET